MAKRADGDLIKVSVVIDAEVKESEWMERFGDHIVSNQLVPGVTLANAVRKSAHSLVDDLGMESLRVK